MAQDGPKVAQHGPKMAQDAPNTGPDGPKTGPNTRPPARPLAYARRRNPKLSTPRRLAGKGGVIFGQLGVIFRAMLRGIFG